MEGSIEMEPVFTIEMVTGGLVKRAEESVMVMDLVVAEAASDIVIL